MLERTIARKAIRTYLETVSWNADNTHRGNCPACNGKNSFGAIRERGKVKYNCFVASCPISGRYDTEITVGELRGIWLPTAPSEAAPFVVPVHFLPIKASPAGLEYLQKFESYQQQLRNSDTIRFDPRLNRVVYLIRNGASITDAAGKGIDNSIKPKWLRYGNASDLYFTSTSCTVPSGIMLRRLIVVEDPISACAVSECGIGAALLGTHLTDSAKLQIGKFKEVVVALDYDATKKAVDIATVIRPLVDKCRVVILEKDLKYYGSSEIERYLA